MRIWIGLGVVLAVAAVSFWLGRQTVPVLPEPLGPPTPHERYAQRVDAAGLGDAALARLWLRASERALLEAPPVEAPFRESGYLESARPEAVAYRFAARRGERLQIEVALDPPANTQIFLDVFRAGDEGASVHVTSADSAVRTLVFEPPRDGEYVVRIQPELLRGGRYTLSVLAEPTLAFPVQGAGPRDVRSVFGDARDGGSRRHHGIDIFAPRGTPVVAAAAGRVARVDSTRLGGRVVWLRDGARGQAIYYAHLEAQLVADEVWVEAGDTVGLVGNSGNARTTPPHLHFGIYRRGVGPMDPFPSVRPRDRTLPAPSLSTEEVGRTRRVSVARVRLRSGPGAEAPVLAELEQDTPVRVAAAAGEWLRVELGDGRRGFLAASLTTVASPLLAADLGAPASLRERPDPEAPEVARLREGERIEVLGRLNDHLYVRARGREAWLASGATR